MTRIHPRLILITTALALALTVAALPSTTAQGNSGSIDVHDGPDADPDTRNEPHVSGDVWVEGFNRAAEEGTLNFYSWPPTGDRELVLSTTWEADGGTPANHFLEGPFFFECGHYRVEAQNGLEEDDFPGGSKSKMFWVEGGEEGCEPDEPVCGEPGQPECPEEPECGEPGQPECPEEPECGEPGQPVCPEEPVAMECPAGLAAVANGDESVTLTWTPAAGSDGTNVYRADGDGDFEYLTTLGPGVGTYTDTTTTAGLTYAYTVTGLYGDEESVDCPVVEVTAIPVFTGAIGLGLAAALGAGLYLLAVRRKA